jgi:hypothetical protein
LVGGNLPMVTFELKTVSPEIRCILVPDSVASVERTTSTQLATS